MSIPKTYDGFIGSYEKAITWEYADSKLRYDADTGALYWRHSERCIVAGTRAGWPTHDGRYRLVKLKRIVMLEHKLVWFLMTKTWPKPVLDHINRDGTDNRFSNLRVANMHQNSANSPRRGANPGARCINGKYYFRIRLPNKTRFESEPFATMEEAVEGYRKMAKEVHGEFYCES